MTRAWSHLPNAAHINRILADLYINPANWEDAWDAVRTDAWQDAREVAMIATWNDMRDDYAWVAARNAVRNIDQETAGANALRAVLALITYDDCAHLLDGNPEDVKLIALLGSPAAILLYPACVALTKQMELV